MVVPAVAQPFRAASDGWFPLGDDAVIAVKADDVFSGHPPLIGMPSTLSNVTAESAASERTSHLGPMLFWLIAIPERFGGRGLGVSLPVAMLAVAAMVGSVLAARRRLGDTAAIALAAGIAVMLVAFGRSVLATPWNPYVALLPLLWYLLLAWRVAVGEERALPLFVVVGSFVAQAHVLYLPTVGSVGVAALVAGWIARRGEARRDRPWREAGTRRSLLGTAVAGAVCWSTVIVDQAFTRDPNLSAVLHSARVGAAETLGLARVVQLVSRALVVPPMFAGGPVDDGRIVSMGAGSALPVVALGACVALLAFGSRSTRVAHDVRRLATLAILAIGAAVWTVASYPLAFPAIATYRLLFLAPLGLFVWFALAAVVADVATSTNWSTSPRLGGGRRRVFVGAAVGGAVAVAVAATVGTMSGADPNRLEQPGGLEAAASLSSAAAEALDPGAVYELRTVGFSSDEGGIGYGVWRELHRRGFEMRVPPADPYLADHYSSSDATHYLVVGASTSSLTTTDGGGVEIARHVIALDPPSGSERAALLERFGEDLPELTAAGRAVIDGAVIDDDAVEAEDLALLAALAEGAGDAEALARGDRLLQWLANRWIDPGSFDIATYLAAREAVNAPAAKTVWIAVGTIGDAPADVTRRSTSPRGGRR